LYLNTPQLLGIDVMFGGIFISLVTRSVKLSTVFITDPALPAFSIATSALNSLALISLL
jgi:hypothetical protein